jgi:putative heme-binding domain-containing protein
MLSPRSSEALQAAAIEAFARFADEGPTLLFERWPKLSNERKRQVIDTCLSRESWVDALLTAVQEKKLSAAEIDAVSTQRLLNHRNDKVRKAATAALAAAIDPDRAAVVAKYVDAVKPETGDAVRGRELFKKSCGACHKVGDVGNAVGPDLAALSDRSPPTMLTSIFDPNRAVESKYVGYTAVTDAGLTLVGMLIAETDATVTLAAADGKEHLLRRAELEEFVGTKRSFMPVGLEKDVSPDGAADLLAFLAASRTPPKSFSGNEPRLVRPEALRGEFYLTADAAEAYGDTLTFAAAPPRFTSWKSAYDRAEWEFEVVAPGAYELSIEYACPTSGGGAYVVDCAGIRLRGKARSTGGRDAFHTETLGPVQLAAGRHRVVVRSDGAVNDGELFDLTSLRLRRR